MYWEPRNEMPAIEGPGGPPIAIMRSTIIDDLFQCTLSQCIHYDNCSEIILTWELLDPKPSTFLAHTMTVVRIPGYRLWPKNGGYESQHAKENRYLVSPRLPDTGMDDLVVTVFAFGLDAYALFEHRNLAKVNLPRVELTL